jgi:hypothetical protein
MKESTLIKMQRELKELQEFVVMLHFEIKSLRDGESSAPEKNNKE